MDSARPQKEIPCKYFYDEVGSALFDEICELDEYYLTRTELAILEAHAAEMAEAIGEDCELIEFGSGSGLKTRLLARTAPFAASLSAGRHRARTPRAIGPSNWPSVSRASASCPCTAISPNRCYCRRPATPGRGASCIFPGSTIGNFSPRAATNLLCTIAWLVGDGGGLLIGFDLDKDESIVWPAYNDRRGVSAAFNLEPARADQPRARRRLRPDARFRTGPTTFARRNAWRCISSAAKPQVVRIAGMEFSFDQGETIHTEYSYKYSLDHFGRLTSRAGFTLAGQWLDPRRVFRGAVSGRRLSCVRSSAARNEEPLGQVERSLHGQREQGGGDRAFEEDHREVVAADAGQDRLAEAAGPDQGADRGGADVDHRGRLDPRQDRARTPSAIRSGAAARRRAIPGPRPIRAARAGCRAGRWPCCGRSAAGCRERARPGPAWPRSPARGS